MEFLSRLLSSLIIGLIALPAFANVPDLPPSLGDMPEYKKELIRMGHFAPYSEQTVRRVIVGKAQIMQNGAIINLPGPEFVPTYLELQVLPKYQYKEPETIFSQLDFGQRTINYSASDELLINVLFWFSHIADVYTTYEGVKYTCIREANPLLPSVPEVNEMIALKGGVIWGVREAFLVDEEYGKLWWNDWKLMSGVLTTLVAYNNYRITEEARGRCPKR